MQYVQEWVSVRFGFLSLHQHLNGHIDFQERDGGWLSPPAQVPDAAFRESGAHFPGDDPTEDPCVLFFLCIYFAFLLSFFAFYLSFLRFLSKSIQFWRSPIRIRGLPFRLVTCPLGRREPQHCAFFGFTGSPRTSLFKSNVSFVFCAGFTTSSRLICFHVCSIWHFPFSLVAFHLSIFSTYHVASFQLALVPSMCSSFVKCAPFQVAFALSIFPPFAIFASFQLAFCFPIFFCNCHVCLFQICIFQFNFCCIVFSIFSRCKHPVSQAQFDSTTLPSCSTWRLKHFDLFLILASDGHGWIKKHTWAATNLEKGAKWLIQWFKLAAHLFQELSF